MPLDRALAVLPMPMDGEGTLQLKNAQVRGLALFMVTHGCTCCVLPTYSTLDTAVSDSVLLLVRVGVELMARHAPGTDSPGVGFWASPELLEFYDTPNMHQAFSFLDRFLAKSSLFLAFCAFFASRRVPRRSSLVSLGSHMHVHAHP
jgi:hypothetical protein